MAEVLFSELKESASKEAKIVNEINSLMDEAEKGNPEEKKMISSQVNSLENSLKKTNKDILEKLEEVSLAKPLLNFNAQKEKPFQTAKETKAKSSISRGVYLKNISKVSKELIPSKLERETIKRLKKKETRITLSVSKKPSKFAEMANRIFFDFSKEIVRKKTFPELEADLSKINLKFTPITYISVILFSVLISSIVGFFIFWFFLFFNVEAALPVITRVTENIGMRFLKVFWILFAFPAVAFLMAYSYPSLEKKSSEHQISQELPFAVIHMSAISESMIEPSKIFSIIVSTREYPYISREFTRLINGINIYGYDLVSALRKSASNSPSRKLADIFNGIATTIHSGGELSEFFSKRAQSLLFDYRIEREKYTKLAETFMDIYISVVVAAPMILMILLIMMKISGLGLLFSTTAITIMMTVGVSMINILFLTFLHVKQSSG